MITLRAIFEDADKLLKDKIAQELRDQGHHLTGALEASLTGAISEAPDQITLVGTGLGYGHILDAGVSAERIPFGGAARGPKGSGGGGTSKYIQALINYWKLRGLDEKEATRAAFATAHKQKQEGMPTSTSYAHSTTGERLNFIDIVSRDIDGPLNQLVLGGIDTLVDQIYHLTPSETL